MKSILITAGQVVFGLLLYAIGTIILALAIFPGQFSAISRAADSS